MSMAVQFPKARDTTGLGRRENRSFQGAAGAQGGMLPPSSVDPDRPLIYTAEKCL